MHRLSYIYPAILCIVIILSTHCTQSSKRSNENSFLESSDGTKKESGIIDGEHKLSQMPNSPEEYVEHIQMMSEAIILYQNSRENILAVMGGDQHIESCVKRMNIESIKVDITGHIQGKKNEFITSIPIQKKYKDPSKNLDITVNFGGFASSIAYRAREYSLFHKWNTRPPAHYKVSAITQLSFTLSDAGAYFGNEDWILDSIKVMVTSHDIPIYYEQNIQFLFDKRTKIFQRSQSQFQKNPAYQKMLKITHCDTL